MLPVKKTALIDITRSSEFTGDDVVRYSGLVDLGNQYEFLAVVIPTLSASGIVSVYVQGDAKVDTVPVILHAFDADATGSFAHSTSSTGGDIVVIFRIGGFQHLRLHVAADQAADRSFDLRGFDGG
ncbi:hypothetical protein LCGC14_1134770 [marine sediment metagenome]|uniref:Uncharacterized protein n=1 Tax=marine sediment metagenome TaxID=412755 RepID=A0A0F9Q5P8_9ZZZZ